MFDGLRAALRAALDSAGQPPNWRDLRAELHAAAVQGRAAVAKMRDDLTRTEHEVTIERHHLDDARRRGKLAAEIDDQETVEVAERFVGRHGERLAVLERKLEVQRAELQLAERDVAEMVAQLKEVDLRAGVRPPRGASEAGAAADDDEALGGTMDQRAREAEAEARLRDLKKRMGR